MSACKLRSVLATLGLVASQLFLGESDGAAQMLADFAIFGNGAVTLFNARAPGEGVKVDGLIGSNLKVIVGDFAETGGVVGGSGGIIGGKSITVNGNIVSNGSILFTSTPALSPASVVNGNVDSGNKVTMGSNTIINGDVTAKSSVLNYGIVTGTITPFGTPEMFTPINVLTELPPKPITGGGPDLTYLGDAVETVTLAPGTYGTLMLGNNKILNLESGTYEFDSIWAGSNLTIKMELSGGPIEILVVGNMTFGGGLEVSLAGGIAADVFTETHGKFLLSNAGNGQWVGTVYAPFDVIDIGSKTVFIGRALSGQAVQIQPGATITPPPPAPVCGNSVIEPPEQCDDGNTTGGDGCSATCQIEPPPVCGNNVIEPPEQCDDGNTTGGDGCSATCQIEPSVGGEGCGTGYWKQSQHFDSWPSPFTQTDLFETIFGRDVPDNPTLLQVLQLTGNDLNALLTHAVAALLNAASPDVDYDLTTTQVITMFQTAFDSGDYEPTAQIFQGYNEQTCPLN